MDVLKKRLERPPCSIGLNGLCCKNCLMGPCILSRPFDVGACGANKDVVTSRNILRFVAGGASAHSGHAFHLLQFLGKKYPEFYIEKKAPKYLYRLWDKLGIVPKIHFEHFKDISEALHTSTMGVNADYQDILKWCMKLGITDGYYGMYLATELEDLKYGKPLVKKGMVNLGVLKEDKVNIAVHGHEPMLAEALVKEAEKNQNKDINLVGVCCTGASLLNKHGIPLAANFILQEDVIASGVVDALAVDVQCIMPSLSDMMECYHTKLITTNDICRMPNATHMPVKNEKEAVKTAREIIRIAKKSMRERNKERINISKHKKEAVVGFSEENLPLKEWADKISKKEVKGIIAVIGCVNPRVQEDWVSAFEELSENYIILTTGCQAFNFAKEGLLDGKKFFHLGSCVNNSRVAEVFKRIAEMSKKEITDLPFMVSCPMPMSEKSIAIGFFFASIGVDVHFGYPFMLTSDSSISKFLENVLREQFKSKIFLETSPQRLKERIRKEGLSCMIR